MKKVFIILMILFTASANAQFKWGLSGGFHSSGLQKRALISTSRQTNIHVGLIADYKFSGTGFHILAKVLYAPMGYDDSNIEAAGANGNTYGSIESHRIKYIQIPIYCSFGAKAGKAEIGGGIGPFISFSTGDKLKIKGGDTFGNGVMLPVGTTEINSTVAGFGMHLFSQWKYLMLGFHFHQSLNGIYEGHYPSAKGWKMNSFGLSLGYFLNQ